MTSQGRRSDAPLQFGILGPLRVGVDGSDVPVGGPKQRGLLAALLIDVGDVVTTDRLAEMLWGDCQPRDPAGTIQIYVSRLRSALAARGGDTARAAIVTRPNGYMLEVDPDRVDANRFVGLIGAARETPTPQLRVELTGTALKLWRGPPLLEFDYARANAEAARLEELRVAAIELRADALLRLGRCQEVVAELEVPVTHHPLHEGLRASLMAALYRCGRQADALTAYRDLRARLVDDLGVEPSPELRLLEGAILRQDEELPGLPPPVDTEVASGEPRTSVGTPATTSLPAELTSLVGREKDLGAVTAAVRDRRVVLLTGVGGVGKSRLALRVARTLAHEYSGGAVLCDLLDAREPAAVAEVVATALGVLPDSRRGTEDAVVGILRARETLLVLDNCEHVLAAASDLADRIGRACPRVDVLATSRRPLRIAGQQIWPLAPLALGESGTGAAVELFCNRATSAAPDFELTDANGDAVVDICRRLDGLPLAIELAAARVRSMNPSDIADRLDHRFDTLIADAGGGSSRHHSLEAVLDWSYGLLPDPTQRVFDRLSVFAGGFTLDAASHLCAGGEVAAPEVVSRLTDLVDHSLVVVERTGRYARYRLLESVRAYGAKHLEERGESAAWRLRHAEYFRSLAEEASIGLRGSDEADWVQLVDIELANFRAAQSWARGAGKLDLVLALTGSLRDYAYYRLHDEVHGWAISAVGLPEARRQPAYAEALVSAAVGRVQRGELPRAREDAERALAAAAHEQVVLCCHQLLAETALYQGRLGEADQRGRMLVERARALGDAYYESLGRLYRVHAAAYGARYEDADAHLAAGWRSVRDAGTPSLRAGYCYLDGEVLLDRDPKAALVALHRAVEVSETVRNRFIAGVARVSIASLEARQGRPGEALAAFGSIIDHWRTRGDWVHLWTTVHNLLVLFERLGATEAAAVLLGGVETAATGAPAFGVDAERMGVAEAALRCSLGHEAFRAAKMLGRGMDDGEIVAFALAQIDRLRAEARFESRS